MIDFILITFTVAVSYFSFRLGAKFQTFKAAADAGIEEIKAAFN